MSRPPEQQNTLSPRWWRRLCQWLWPGLRYIWLTILIGGVGLTLLSTLLTSKGFNINPILLEWIHDHWPLVLAGGVLFFILTMVVYYLGRPVASPARVLPTPQDRRALIRRLSDEYHRQQAQSLQEAAMMSLERQEPAAVTLSSASLVPWQMDVPGKASLAAPTPIVQAYDQASAGLLILGDPGVGKSTLLLELAFGLLTRAEQDTTQPVPVLVNLSSWALNKPLLTTWLEERLHAMCRIQPRLTRGWIEQNELLLLLDGLDEMEQDARPTCIASINAYRDQAKHVVSLVVSSRREEYLAQKERLQGLETIEVQRLTPEQVEGYLKRVGKPLEVVQTALQRNATLREVVITPLLLSMVILAYQGKTVEDLPHLGLAEEQQRQLFEDYVKRKLEQEAPRWHQHTQHWLIWLAQRMRGHDNQTEFYLERLQPDWLPKRQMAFYQLSIGLVVGLSAGLVYGLVVGLVGLAFGLYVGLVYGLDTKIELPEILITWSREGLVSGLVFGLGYGLVFGLVFGLGYGLAFGLGYGLLFGLLSGVIYGFSRKNQLTERLMFSPNEEIRRSLKSGLVSGLLLGLLFGLSAGLGSGLVFGQGCGLVFRLGSVQVFRLDCGLGSGLVFGLLGLLLGLLGSGLGAATQHYVLRFWLWQARCTPAPWRVVPFLEDATKRKLLQSVGGGYRFIHPLLQEYFASLGALAPSPSVQSHPSQQP